MASITPMSFFTPDASINPDEYTFEIADAAARNSIASTFNLKDFPTASDVLKNVSLNNVHTPGLYHLTGGIEGCPYGNGYGYLVVYSSDPQNGVPQNARQIFYPAGADVFFERRKYQGTWNAWVQRGNTFTSGSFSKAVTKQTITQLGSMSVPAGTWLIVSHMGLGSGGGTSMFNHYLGDRVVRSTELAGGGSINIIITSGPSNVLVRTYTSVDTTVTEHYSMIRLY